MRKAQPLIAFVAFLGAAILVGFEAGLRLGVATLLALMGIGVLVESLRDEPSEPESE